MNSRLEFHRGLFAPKTTHRETLGEESFHRMVSIERRRTKRSQKSFLLMLLDVGEHSASHHHRVSLHKILSTLSLMLRDTDVTGWYKQDSVVGVMFTEITLDDQKAIPATMMSRVSQTLKRHLTPQQFHQIGISFHLFPEAPEHEVAASTHPAVFRGVAAANGATDTSL